MLWYCISYLLQLSKPPQNLGLKIAIYGVSQFWSYFFYSIWCWLGSLPQLHLFGSWAGTGSSKKTSFVQLGIGPDCQLDNSVFLHVVSFSIWWLIFQGLPTLVLLSGRMAWISLYCGSWNPKEQEQNCHSLKTSPRAGSASLFVFSILLVRTSHKASPTQDGWGVWEIGCNSGRSRMHTQEKEELLCSYFGRLSTTS